MRNATVSVLTSVLAVSWWLLLAAAFLVFLVILLVAWPFVKRTPQHAPACPGMRYQRDEGDETDIAAEGLGVPAPSDNQVATIWGAEPRLTWAQARAVAVARHRLKVAR